MFCAISLVLSAHTVSRPAKYGATNGTSSERSCTRPKPAIVAAWIAFGRPSWSTTDAHAVALAAAVGTAARAAAAAR